MKGFERAQARLGYMTKLEGGVIGRQRKKAVRQIELQNHRRLEKNGVER